MNCNKEFILPSKCHSPLMMFAMVSLRHSALFSMVSNVNVKVAILFFAASPRNPQTESLLQLLELPYLLDRNPEEKNLSPYPSPSIQRGNF